MTSQCDFTFFQLKVRTHSVEFTNSQFLKIHQRMTGFIAITLRKIRKLKMVPPHLSVYEKQEDALVRLAVLLGFSLEFERSTYYIGCQVTMVLSTLHRTLNGEDMKEVTDKWRDITQRYSHVSYQLLSLWWKYLLQQTMKQYTSHVLNSMQVTYVCTIFTHL